MWDEGDTQKTNFKSQHPAMPNPSLPDVSVSRMLMCLDAKILPVWLPVGTGKGPCPVDRGTWARPKVLAWLIDVCASHEWIASTY